MEQARQLGKVVRSSDADVIVAAGDFNSWPINQTGITGYSDVAHFQSQIESLELGNKIACTWIGLKISRMVGYDQILNDLKVVQDLSGRKEAGAVSRSLRQRMDGKSFNSKLKGAKVSRMSQAYSHVVSHGDSSMRRESYF